MKKFFIYLLLFLVCIAGTICFVNIYEEKTKASSSIGTPSYKNAYEDFNLYCYDLSDEYFYLDKTQNLYVLEKTYSVKTDFNGEEFTYNIMFNNIPCYRMSSSAGILYAEHNISYKDLNNETIGSTFLTIEFKFYLSEVEIKITATNNDNYSRFLDYLNINGIKLDIIEGQLSDMQQTSSSFDGYYVKILNGDGSIYKVYYYLSDGTIATEIYESLHFGNSRNNDVTLENGLHQRQEGWTDGKNIYSSIESFDFRENTILTPYYENYCYVDYYVPYNGDLELYVPWSGNLSDVKPNTEYTLKDYYPSIEGYNFIGWSIDNKNVLSDSTIIVTEDIVLYALYEKSEPTVTEEPTMYAGLTLQELIDGGYVTLTEGALSATSTFAELGTSDLIVPAEVTSIAASGFLRAPINNLDLSNSNVQIIGPNAFEWCTIHSVKWSPNLIEISDSAFSNGFFALDITEMIIPESVVYIGEKAFYSALTYCNKLVISSTVQSIGKQAFYKIGTAAAGQTSIYIPSSVTTITASSANYGPFSQADVDGCIIYTGIEESAIPSGWGTYWKYSKSGSVLTVNYGYTYEEFLTAIGE